MKRIVFLAISISITTLAYAQTEYDYYDDDVAYQSHNSNGDFFTGLIVIAIIALVIWVINYIIKDFKGTNEQRNKYQESKARSQRSTPRSTLGAIRRASEFIVYDFDKQKEIDIQIFNQLVEKAKQGDVDTQFKVGYHYYSGMFIERDYSEAKKWIKIAAEQKHVKAQRYLGEIYYRGLGVEQNFSEAVKWFREAAEQGDADAQFMLGLMYEEGYGVPISYSKAKYWYEISAEQGCESAQRQLKKRIDPSSGQR